VKDSKVGSFDHRTSNYASSRSTGRFA